MPDPAAAPAAGTTVDDFAPPLAFHFALSFEAGRGVDDVAFQEAGGLNAEMSIESVREGGENRFAHQLPTGVKHPKLSLKRGVAPLDSGLVKWCKTVLEGGLSQRIRPQQVELRLLDTEGNPLRSWSFENAYPVKWSVSEFQSRKNDVAIETVEFAYSAVTRTR